MSKFFRRGKSKVYWVPTIASASLIPTTAEVTAGTAMTANVAGFEGFSFSNNPIEVPDLSTAFTASVPGEDKAEDCALVFYEDDTTNALQTTLAKGTTGYVVIFPTGTAGASPAASDKAEVWKVIVTGWARRYDMGNVAAQWRAGFTPTVAPNMSATLT